MAKANVALVAFNRGRISKLALARTDFSRTQLSAEIQTNWMPRALGSMMLRPGWEFTGATKGNAKSITIPFIKATDDTARLELTDSVMRVWVNDVLVTRVSVTTSIANGTFTSNLTSWSDQDGGSSVSAWVAGGYMSLIGDTNAAAKRRQQVTVAGGNIGARHALGIVINRGPVLIRVGSTAGGDDYIAETVLETGYHSLAFTPSGDFYVDLFNYNEAASLVDSIAVASAGAMELTAPWLLADLPNLRWDQSGDVVFVACDGYRQRRIERRAVDSWSIVEYKSDDGPFRIQNVGPTTITPAATSGDTTLTASVPLFHSTQVGALFKLTHTGQRQDGSLSGADQYCLPIRVIGVDGTRTFAIETTGVWVGTLTLQYSISAPGSWVDAAAGTFTTNAFIAYDDTLDNQVIYYRIGFKPGAYTSGTATVSLSNSSGSQTGIARITAFTSATVVDAAVITEFAETTATADWSESYWSAYRGYPSSVALYEGRLWWAGKDRVWGSVSDGFASFDDETEGDSGPISRTIGSGPVDTIFWLVPANRLLLGAGGAVSAIRSTSLDEPITPTNYNRKDIDTPGAGATNVAAVKSGTGAVYVQQSGQSVYEAGIGDNGYDYVATDLSVHVPEIGEPSIVKIVEQQQPERRRHCIRSDGTVAVMVYDKAEDVKCWVDAWSTGASGFVEDAVVEPGAEEDKVTYTVKRTIGGSTVRYHERWAKESECTGFPGARHADAFVYYSGAAVTTITGLTHLNGEEVVCWGWNTVTPFLNDDGDAVGRDLGTFTVSGGQITGLPVAVTNACVGLYFEAPYQSTKLAYGVADGTALCAKKKVNKLGVIAINMHPQGLQYGPDFDNLDGLPMIEDGTEVNQDGMWSGYDKAMFSFDGRWDTDSRLCLLAAAPRPVTLLAAVIDMSTNQE